jgi:NSS family neurotransmitter:Na+ symporter
MTNIQTREWSSPVNFLYAAIAAAVGLGNIWRFPYLLGTQGGSAFLLLYLAFMVFICVAMIAAETFLGRTGGRSAVGTMRVLTERYGFHPGWRMIGLGCMISCALVYSFYSVVAGWSLDYLWLAVSGGLQMDPDTTAAQFGGMLSEPYRLIGSHTVVIIFTAVVIGYGINAGIERCLKFMMPALFVLLLMLVAYAMIVGDAGAAAAYLLRPDFSVINSEVVIMAMGQALFSVAVGGGAMMTFGAYLPQSVSIPRMAATIAVADTVVALLAGFAIFPWVFEYGLDPAEGPGLIFVVLPIAFGQMPWGELVAVLFFVLLAFAALSTTLTLLEPLVAWIEEYGLARPLVTILVSLVIWTTGTIESLSFNLWEDLKPLQFVDFLADKNIFGLTENLVTLVVVPLNILAMAIFVGWKLLPKVGVETAGFVSKRFEWLWVTLLKYVLPIAIGTIFIAAFF